MSTRVLRGSVVKFLTRSPGIFGTSRTGSSGFFVAVSFGKTLQSPSLVLVRPRKDINNVSCCRDMTEILSKRRKTPFNQFTYLQLSPWIELVERESDFTLKTLFLNNSLPDDEEKKKFENVFPFKVFHFFKKEIPYLNYIRFLVFTWFQYGHVSFLLCFKVLCITHLQSDLCCGHTEK